MSDPKTALMGGFYPAPSGPAPAPVPFVPPGARGPAPPPPIEYVDRIEHGPRGRVATLVDPHGNVREAPAEPHWRESAMTDGSMPSSEADALRAKLGAGDAGGPIDLNALGSELPKVPMAPGAGGAPIPPAADSFIGKPKGKSQGRRRPIP